MQIHDEVMKKLECMAYTCWHDACIGGVSHTLLLWAQTLQKMYTMEELRAAGVTTAHDHFSQSCNLQVACWLRVWGEQHYQHWGPPWSDGTKYRHRDSTADPHPHNHQWQREGLARSSHQGAGPHHRWSCETSPRMASGGGPGHHRCCPTQRGLAVQL